MDHFKVYDSAPSPLVGRTTGANKRTAVSRPKAEAQPKVSAENGDSSRPQAPADLVKLPTPVRKLTDAQIRAKIAAHQEGNVSAAPNPAPASAAAPSAGSGAARSTPEVEMPQSDLAKNDPSDPVTQHKLRSLISNGGFNFSQGERKVLEGILGTKPQP